MKNIYASLSKIHNFSKAISDKNRLKILKFLTCGEKCVCEIWKSIGLSQNLTSHHLKILNDSNLISSKKTGLKVIYRLNKDILEEKIKRLAQFLTSGAK